MIRGDSPAESLRGLVPELNDIDNPLARRRRLHPAHGGKWNRKGLAGGWMSSVGGDAVVVLEVRGEHAVVSGEMGARSWHEGGEAGEAVHRVEHDMSRRVMEGVLESIDDLPAVIDREAFVRDRWSGDAAGTGVRGSPVHGPGTACRPPIAPFGGAMVGESSELSDARSVYREIGCDGAQGQALAPRA